MKRLAVGFVTFSLVCIASSPPVHAQTAPSGIGALNITNSPLPISIKSDPGRTISKDLRIKNNGIENETLKVGLMKFDAYGEEGKPRLKEREEGDDYFDWVSFSEPQFTFGPNEWKSIVMTITIPETAALDYFYAVTFQRANPLSVSGEQTNVLHGGTATLVLLDVSSPNARREIAIEQFAVTKKRYEFLPVNFEIKLKNSGNVYVAPKGNIYIKRGEQVTDTITVNSTGGNILPDSSRIFKSDWSNGFPFYQPKIINGSVALRDGKPQHSLVWPTNQIKNFRIGKFTAHLTMVYVDGERDIPVDASVDFWVIPWRLLAIVVGLPLAFIAFVIYLLIKIRRLKKRSQGVKRIKF